jgi:hypothetical protein
MIQAQTFLLQIQLPILGRVAAVLPPTQEDQSQVQRVLRAYALCATLATKNVPAA